MLSAKRPLILAAAFAGMSMLSACGANPSGDAAQHASGISGAVQSAVAQAKKEIAEGNINIDNGKGGKRVELSPKGDLIIDGTPVPVTPEQRALLIDYRGHVANVANAGVEIGLQGADLATKAVTESLKGVFTGNTDDIDSKVQAETAKIEAAALKLCNYLPGMMQSQDRLAASLPQFRPYANLTQSDIDDCRKEASEKGHKVTASAEAKKAESSEAQSKQ